MSQYFPQESQRPQKPQQEPYSAYNPYSPDAQPTYITPPAQSPYIQPQQSQAAYPSSNQKISAPQTSQKLSARIWQALVRFLGIRGVVVAAGALLALLAFFTMPLYSNYSGFFLASETLDDKWWLELVFSLLPLLIVVGLPVVERIRQQKRRWSLAIAGSGILGVLFNYWFLNGIVSNDYWRFGAWSYFLGMLMVAVGGVLFFFS